MVRDEHARTCLGVTVYPFSLLQEQSIPFLDLR